jgi:DNA polymerase-3 subunit beta
MEISTSGADYSLFGNGPEDFPSLPSIDEINTIEFPLPTFRNMMSKVLYSVSMDETKRELCGVLLQGDGRTFRMVATDGRRLGQAEIEIPAGFDKFNDVIVPAKVMRELHKFQNPDMVLKMTVCRTQVVFTLDDITYTSRLIEGNYPDYNKVVPSEKCCTIKVDTDLLLKNLRGIMPIAREVSFTVKCRFGKDSLEIAALSSKIGKGRRYVDIQNDGEPINISYNARYLQDCLTAINSEYTIFEPVSTVKATRIVPETDPTMEKHVNVLMPVRTA